MLASPSYQTPPASTKSTLSPPPLPSNYGSYQQSASTIQSPANSSPNYVVSSLPPASMSKTPMLPSIQSRSINSPVKSNYSPFGSPVQSTSTSTSASAHSHSHLDVAHNINHIITEHNYIILQTISHNNTVNYVKAYSEAGDIVFIHVNRDGSFVVDGNVVEVIHGEELDIDESFKSNLSQCSGNNCGVGFECNKGFCMVKKEDSGELFEHSFIVSNESSNRTIITENSPVAFPIVTIDEIEANNAMVVKSIRDSTRAIQERVKTHAAQKSAEFLAQLERLHHERKLARFNERFDKLIKYWEMQRDTYIKYLNTFRQMKHPLSPANKERYDALIKTLHHHNELYIRLFTFIDEFNTTIKTLDYLDNKFTASYYEMFLTVINYYPKNIENHNKVGPKYVDNPIRHPGNWDLPSELYGVDHSQLAEKIEQLDKSKLSNSVKLNLEMLEALLNSGLA